MAHSDDSPAIPSNDLEPLVLGIETSCDDTACALVARGGRVLSSVVSSQLAAHRPYGGVVPEIASREHLANWQAVSRRALEEAGVELSAVDAVAATRGPGLVGSLLVGLSLGKALAYGLGKPFLGVHHLEGHLYSPFLETDGTPAETPPEHFVGLVVSGGHTSLYDVRGSAVTTLAETRDDAMGEVFDKVGKRVGLPYPQGPLVDRLAELGDRRRAEVLPIASTKESLDFSYSGLKTAALLAIEALERTDADTAYRPEQDPPFEPPVLDLLAAFRYAAVEQILRRLRRLHRRRPIPLLAVSGGAAANRLLRRQLETWAAEEKISLRLVPLTYAGDNAAMIAHAAAQRLARGETDDPLDSEAASRLVLG
ncbi:MAG: tRNA (adenosine(37)-N6)-threonylcarbamoyltransferase complex transferase subunit TsaD [Acidobacteriota bacterium]|nr:tRNA (adenosine(37)-N6)-threonylcarbamoyltransferase complex transferase subunit TsaD [Acidobacteriota bacterium]